ncbi:sporulation protein YqfD [Geosporobacter ferrireducens]|uniref:Sporulation protein YqfD n=1 Tax=Geosporobacter ferrireducens TaxID=1424294 RepID=A0A1D8GC89_9FIRM|nr:sporulation protein YqfD [Geosporobacter ferrireducens]AOT68521.1 sporulation protein YqfD [Geosporobacter ferrireducens]
MSFGRLWYFFRGYVVIRIEGLALEKFINYAIARGIYIWDIVRLDYTTLEAKTGLRSYKKLRSIIKKSGCRIKIYEKIGYPFFMHKMKTRRMMLLGAVLSLFLIFAASSFVWDIQIFGIETISRREVETYLERMGLRIGAYKYQLDIQTIENEMMIQIDQLAWIGIEMKGTKAIVQIVEKVSPPPLIPINTPCNIIANKNGVIEKVVAKNGEAKAEKGDIVKTGDVLISGIIAKEGQEIRYVHALGEVYAKTYYEENEEMDTVVNRKIRTGNVFKRKIFRVQNNELILSNKSVPYTNYILEIKKKSLPSWRNIELPVEIIFEEYYEVFDEVEVIDKEIVKQALKEKILVKILNKIPENIPILNQDLQYQEENTKIKVKMIIETLEEISAQQKLW